MKGSGRKKYSVKKLPVHKHAYALSASEDILAKLELHNHRGSSAHAEVKAERMHLARPGMLRRRIEIQVPGSKEALSVPYSLGYRTSIRLGEEEYAWGPANKRWTQWAWRRVRDGEEVMRYHLSFRLLKTEAEIESERDLSEHEHAYLALVGWYLLLQYMQEVELGALSALPGLFRK